jgi:hypothetical protein
MLQENNNIKSIILHAIKKKPKLEKKKLTLE